MSAGAVVVIGVGNLDRGDDAAGREVAKRLRGVFGSEIEIVEMDGEATSLLARLEGADAAFLIDACVSGAPPGTARRFDLAQTSLSCVAFGLSSHGFGLGAAIDLAKTLGLLPRRCVVYAIEGASFEIGAPVSTPVRRAIEKVAEKLRREIIAINDYVG
jgi:hydrogenase maturation protease